MPFFKTHINSISSYFKEFLQFPLTSNNKLRQIVHVYIPILATTGKHWLFK